MESQVQSEIDTILVWLTSFPNLSKNVDNIGIEGLSDGILLLEALNQMDSVIWSKELIDYDATKYSKQNFCLIIQGMKKFYKKMGCQQLDCFTHKDYINPEASKYTKPSEILQILQLILGVAVQCDDKEYLINEILTNLDETLQSELMRIIQEVLQKYAPSYQFIEGDSEANSRNFSSQSVSDLVAAIDKLEEEKKAFMKNINELESENSKMKEQVTGVIKEKDELLLKNQNIEADMKQAKLGQIEMKALDMKLEQVRELETELEMKGHQLKLQEKNYQNLKKEFASEKERLNEELEVEREQIFQLRKQEISIADMKKKLENMKEVQKQSQQQEYEIKNLNEQIFKFTHESSQMQNLEQSIQFLKEELSKEKSKHSQLELQLQQKDHEVQDLQSDLKIWKKKDDMNAQKLKELQLELEETKNFDNSILSGGGGSLQGSIVQDLELKVSHLQQENEILKMTNTSSINAKLIEIETKLEEEKRQKLTLQSQLEVSQQRCRKLESSCENLKLDIQSAQITDSPKNNSELKNLREERDVAFERLVAANQKLTELEMMQQQVQNLNKLKDEQLQEIKTIYQEKTQLKEETLILKDELNQAKNALQERQLKDQYAEMEKKMLEQQVQQLREKEKYLEQNYEREKTQSLDQAELDSMKMKMEKERLKLENQVIHLQMQLREKEEQLREKEYQLEGKQDEQRKIYSREIKELEVGYESEIIQLKKAIQELDNEVKMERQIRYEQEKANQQQDELVNSLIVNLGIELMNYQKQAQQQVTGQSNPIMNTVGSVTSNSTASFMQKKRQQTYKTFNN